MSKPSGKDYGMLNDSESLGSLFDFDEIIRFDKIVEREKMLALRRIFKYKMVRAKFNNSIRRWRS